MLLKSHQLLNEEKVYVEFLVKNYKIILKYIFIICDMNKMKYITRRNVLLLGLGFFSVSLPVVLTAKYLPTKSNLDKLLKILNNNDINKIFVDNNFFYNDQKQVLEKKYEITSISHTKRYHLTSFINIGHKRKIKDLVDLIFTETDKKGYPSNIEQVFVMLNQKIEQDIKNEDLILVNGWFFPKTIQNLSMLFNLIKNRK